MLQMDVLPLDSATSFRLLAFTGQQLFSCLWCPWGQHRLSGSLWGYRWMFVSLLPCKFLC